MLTSTCNRYWCLPESSPFQISKEVGCPCLQFPGPLSSITLSHSPLCQDVSLTPAILLVLLRAGAGKAEDSLEKVLVKKKAEEGQGMLESTISVVDYLSVTTKKVGGGEGFG